MLLPSVPLLIAPSVIPTSKLLCWCKSVPIPPSTKVSLYGICGKMILMGQFTVTRKEVDHTHMIKGSQPSYEYSINIKDCLWYIAPCYSRSPEYIATVSRNMPLPHYPSSSASDLHQDRCSNWIENPDSGKITYQSPVRLQLVHHQWQGRRRLK